MGGVTTLGEEGRDGRGAENTGCSTMLSTRPDAVRINSGIAAASGRLRQYFCGISARIAPILSRAGLKMLL